MQARMKNPAMIIPEAMQPIQGLTAATQKGGADRGFVKLTKWLTQRHGTGIGRDNLRGAARDRHGRGARDAVDATACDGVGDWLGCAACGAVGGAEPYWSQGHVLLEGQSECISDHWNTGRQ